MGDPSHARIAELCHRTIPSPDHQGLLQGLHRLSPDHRFRWVLTRGGWYRLGGLVTPEGARVTDNLELWAQALFRECGGAMEALVERVVKARYLATRWLGKTHYFVAPTGEGAAAFLQLEVEEIQEVIDRALFNETAPPEDLDELIDPVVPRAHDVRPRAAPHYSLRRITDIKTFLAEMSDRPKQYHPIKRFVKEWEDSSAGRATRFCDHWVLNLRRHTGPHSEPILNATPACTFGKPIPRLHIPAIARGPDLARLVQRFDHELGYPFAWYFCMVHSHHVPKSLGDTVYQDLWAGFQYLPDSDQAILSKWIRYPYCL